MTKKQFAALFMSVGMTFACTLASCGTPGTGSGSSGGSAPADSGAPGESSEVETVYYTVTFDSRGGTPVEPITVEAGGKISEPDEPSLDGGGFVGWVTDPEDEDSTWNFITGTVTSDLTLYAWWDVTYTIYYYNVDEETQRKNLESSWEHDYEATSSIKSGGYFSSPNYSITPGYTYDKWYTDEELTTEYDASRPVTGDLKLYGTAKFLDSWDFSQGKGWWYTRSQTGYQEETKITEEDGYIKIDFYSAQTIDVGIRLDGLRIPVSEYGALKFTYKCLGDPYRVNIYYNTAKMTSFGDDTSWKNTCAIKKNMSESDAWETVYIDLEAWTNNYTRYASENDKLQSMRLDFPLKKAGDHAVVLLQSMEFVKYEDMEYASYTTTENEEEKTTSVMYDLATGGAENAGLLGWQYTASDSSSYYRNNSVVHTDEGALLTIRNDEGAGETDPVNYPALENSMIRYSIDLSLINSITVKYKASTNISKVMLQVIPEDETKTWFGKAWFELPAYGANASEWSEITIGIADYSYKEIEVDGADGSQTVIDEKVLFSGAIRGIRFVFDGDFSEADGEVLVGSVALDSRAETAEICEGSSKITENKKTITSIGEIDEEAGTFRWNFAKGCGKWFGRLSTNANVEPTAEDGYAKFVLNAAQDGGIWIKGLSMNIDSYDTLTIRFSATNAISRYRMYIQKDGSTAWVTCPDTGAAATKSYVTVSEADENGIITVTYDLSAIAGWGGTLNAIRLDFITTNLARTLSVYDITLSKSAA